MQRIKAEYKAERLAKNLEYIENLWISKYSKLGEDYQQLSGKHAQLSEVQAQTQKNLNSANLRIEDVRVELRDTKNQFAEATILTNKYLKMTEQLQDELTDIKKKYHNSLDRNRKVMIDLTKANEDYIDIARENEKLREALKKAKIQAKKTIKLKI